MSQTPCPHAGGWAQDCCICLTERIFRLRDALEAVLLFHSASPWDDEKRKKWERYSGGAEATTRILCSLVRVAIAGGSE